MNEMKIDKCENFFPPTMKKFINKTISFKL